MTAAAVLHSFFNSFGIPGYVTTSIPEYDDIEFPYLTYESAVAALGAGDIALTVTVFYYGESELAPNAKSLEIYKACLRQPKLTCDGGFIWVKGADRVLAVPDDAGCKTRRMNVTIEYITTWEN